MIVRTRLLALALAIGGLSVFASSAAATPWINPSTGNPYHWARTANPFTVKLGSDVTSGWTTYLGGASIDWSKSGNNLSDYFGTFTSTNPLRTTVVGGLTTGRKCRASSGRVEVCDARYGNNGWLGLATIWVSGDHINQGTVKLNDTYYDSGYYNTPVWRGAVACQEIGHTFGLDHQDESGANFHTCMDYANTPDSWNTHPNRYDYSTLVDDYTHLDSTSTIAAATTSPGPRGLQRVRDDLYVEDLGRGNRRFVWVAWTVPSVRHGPPDEGDG